MNVARGARVIKRTPLLYTRGADPGLDRPSHVRAGSALVALGEGRLAVFQDDACFLAIIEPKTGRVHDIPFDGDGDGKRQFDDSRGNKHRKLDLEAAFLVQGNNTGSNNDGNGEKDLLVALGSGSSPVRERFVLVEDPTAESPQVTIVQAPALYAAMRANRAFAGSELNVEGACVVGEDLLLFQRGNGAPTDDCGPVDATVRVDLAMLLRYLLRGEKAPPLRNVVAWDLGLGNDHPLTFTDGAITPRGAIAFLACAEDSPDATKDGPVTAVAIGCLDDTAPSLTCEIGLILDEKNLPLLDKAEGLTFDPDDPSRAFVVTDRDEPNAPSELLELRLSEAWMRDSPAG